MAHAPVLDEHSVLILAEGHVTQHRIHYPWLTAEGVGNPPCLCNQELLLCNAEELHPKVIPGSWEYGSVGKVLGSQTQTGT